jgi:hypothetical protein
MSMSFNWTKASENSGPPSMSEGWHKVRVAKVIHEKKDGTRFETDKGPFFMVVFENVQGEQGTLSLWPSEKAAWKIAQTLSCLGVSMDQLEQAGISPVDFDRTDVAEEWFIGREAWANVTVKGKYANVDLHHEDNVPVSVLQSSRPAERKPDDSHLKNPSEVSTALTDDDIPF